MFVGCTDGDKTLTKIRVNEVTHSVFYTPFYLAIELNYFEDEGIEIELTNGGGSNVSMTAIYTDISFGIIKKADKQYDSCCQLFKER